jgi:uncharacterized protein YndB with AHSA1/START domain
MADTTRTENTAAADKGFDDRTLVIERVFTAPPEEVFQAWIDPATLIKWWGPETFKTPDCRMDVRPGGSWRTVMVSPQGEPHIVSGTYREILPPRRLVMTWGWEHGGKRGHETEVVVTFEPLGAGTRLRLVQRVFQTTADRDNHNMGWTSSFNDLERLLAD